MVTSKNPLFHGASSEVITPFSAEGRLEPDLLRNEIEFMIEKGITGFFVNGLASEALMMDEADRRLSASIVRKASEGKAPIIGNIIANSTTEAVRIAREYQDMGMDAIANTPPIVYKFQGDGLYSHYMEVIESVEIPVFIYNAPETGNKLTPNFVAKLFNQNPRFIGYKDSTQNIIELLTLLGELEDHRHLELMAGSDALIMPIMMLGGIGVISLVSVVFPELIIDLCAACSAQDWETANKLQSKVLRVRGALKIGPFMAAYKYVGELVGIPLGVVKQPLTGLNQKEKDTISSILNNEGLL